MVLNYIWIAFFLIAFVVAVGKLVNRGDTADFTEYIKASLAYANKGLEELNLRNCCAYAA